MNPSEKKYYSLNSDTLDELISLLISKGYTIIAPVYSDGVIILDEISKIEDLPKGISDWQSNASYETVENHSAHHFSYAVGPHSWKKYLYPPYQKLVKSQKIRGGWKLTPEVAEDVKYAFLGVRPCETIALLLSDKVFLTEKFTDVSYKSRRENTLIITVNCTHPADTCFCTSMDAGPEAKSGYDIALTEISYGRSVWYLADEGSEKGVELLKSLNLPLSNESEVQIMEDSLQEASANITRKVETTGLKDDLFSAFDSSRWKETEKRCLTCGNCTMVCPTCFCSTMEDSTNLTGNESQRIRKWDSCFTMDYSYIHGGSIRYSGEARYRNWLTHKFSTWIDQFGDFGCVGCGRCITWCPAGIDVTEEIEAIRTGIVSQLI